jgi:hypothetical protein
MVRAQTIDVKAQWKKIDMKPTSCGFHLKYIVASVVQEKILNIDTIERCSIYYSSLEQQCVFGFYE